MADEESSLLSASDGLPAPQRRRAMLCIMLGLVLSNLGLAVVNIALPDISRVFDIRDATTIWVVNAYQLAATACLLPTAAMAETLGVKRIYLVGMGIFILSSLACALSPSFAVLVCARLAQGAGAALISVTGVTLIRLVYPRRLVGKGMALLALAVAVPGALGPTVAALILAVAGWPWLFLLNVPIGALIIYLFLEVSPPAIRADRSFDPAGTLLNALAFGLLVVGVAALGAGEPKQGLAEILGGLLCFGLLFAQQARHPMPMLPFDLLRIRAFTLAVFTSICSYTVQNLAYVSLPFMFEQMLRLSPVMTGLLLTPWPLMTAASAPIAGRLTLRYPAWAIGTIGMGGMAIGLLLLVLLPARPAEWDIAWRLAICGVGFGLFQTPNNTAMMTAGPIQRSGAASGMNAVARFTGWTLGAALVALIFGFGGARATVICLETGVGFALAGGVASVARK